MRMLLIGALVLGAPALAADADPFQPSGSVVHGTGTLQGEFPRLAGEGLAVALLGSIAEDLVVLEFPDGTEEPVLATAFGTQLYGAYTVADVGRFEVVVPFYGYVEAPRNAFAGAAMGDVEVRGLFPLLDAGEGFALALQPRVGLPTGQEKAYLTRGFSGGLTVAMGGMLDTNAGWVVDLGVTAAEPEVLEGVTLGSSFDGVVGAWVALDDTFRVGADARLAVGLSQQEDAARHSLATGHAFAQILSPSGFSLVVGGGSGIGVGAPEYRMFGGLTYAPVKSDRDRDGIGDADDTCRDEAEDLDAFEDTDGCPDDDNDGDGLADTDDRCPGEGEDADDFEDEDGCPEADNDEDGLADADDRCPVAAGPAADDGCPDTDADGLVDPDDECVEEAGTIGAKGCPDDDGDLVPNHRDLCPDQGIAAEALPEYSNGCPSVAYMTEEAIEIDRQIQFGNGTADIAPASTEILDEVAAIMQDFPEIGLVEVAGHTDNVGNPQSNQELSERRAEAVALYLVDRGVDPKRLMPVGYGENRPIDTNRTSTGRANNRRVEFLVRRMGPPPTDADEAPDE